MGRAALEREPDFGSHVSLRALAETYVDPLVGHQLRNRGPPQDFHMNEDIRLGFAFTEEAETTGAIEPFHLGANPAARRCDIDMGAARPLDRVDGGRCVDPSHPQALISLLALDGFANDPGAFGGSIEAVAFKTAQMQKDVGHAVVGNDKSVTPRNVKPLHETGNLEDFDVCFRPLLLDSSTRPYGSAPRHAVYPTLWRQSPSARRHRID